MASMLKFISGLFKRQKNKTLPERDKDENTYNFHEDFYCQIEFLPKEGFNNVSKVAKEVTEFSEQHFDGNGWTECYVRNEASVPTKDKRIQVTDVVDFLKQHEFGEYSKVTTGYGQYEIRCENTRAFRRESIVVCFDYEDNILKNIWLNTSPQTVDNTAYKTFLLCIADKYNFLLADWWKSIVVDISSPNEIDKYFQSE
jgi:hypothetical protein